MTPKNIDIHIICAKCNKPIVGENRSMVHDPAAGLWKYTVKCHGAVDSGPHLTVRAHEDSHDTILNAFESKS